MNDQQSNDESDIDEGSDYCDRQRRKSNGIPKT